jgi:hypothetical protein
MLILYASIFNGQPSEKEWKSENVWELATEETIQK